MLSVALFATVTSGTPGPNNVMLTASGANFGYWRTLPHMVGIVIGILVMNVLVAAGLGVVFERYPAVQSTLKVAASSYLVYLAWKIATAETSRVDGESDARPMSLMGGALFQFLNPKAWMMVITAIGSFTLAGDDYWMSVFWVAVIFMLMGFPCISLWAAFGTVVGRFLSSPAAMRWFNLIMGGLTVSCLVFIWQ
ncbi:LysE family translocator [Pontibacterium sp. N1Y112]|uniref:LysE family translocator n=2 Tax=Pontibacterium sinense TaxID=2781979 RepID=A0A8J7FEN3_9GAMM|nr:LysE family translocator [Pontibacterium sinense]MBE9398259.1 LysE family translocator [Pontibacterium sinense]